MNSCAMCDIHMHLIPGVDDGAMTAVMAYGMLVRAYLEGIREVFATPHSSAFDRPGKNPQSVFSILQDLAARLPEDMRLYPGCEIYCDIFQMDSILDALDSGRYPALNGTAFVLAEFSPRATAEQVLQCTDALAARGWTPVIAHAERYPWLRGRQDILSHFRKTGSRLQINVHSLAENAEEDLRDFARELVKAELADFLGSDAHNTGARPPRAEEGIAWILANCSPAYAEALIRKNAQTLLINGEG